MIEGFATAGYFNIRCAKCKRETQNEYQRTLVRRGSSIGANATIVCGVTLGEYAFIGAGAVITKDVLPYALMAGVPARRIGWMCQCGERLSASGVGTCAACGTTYAASGEGIAPVNPG